MPDLILDANVLGDFLTQFFDAGGANRGLGEFVSGRFLSKAAAREINRITRSYRRNDDLFAGMVVISSFGLVELFRKWEEITLGGVDTTKMRAFLAQPPEWLSIASVDETLIPAFLYVPTHVYSTAGFQPVDWTDAVHVATALARGDGNYIASTDVAIRNLNLRSRLNCL